jgi:pimeloyl-ACP methyl ester carboxylesterase
MPPDEFAALPDNASEAGLPWTAPPAVDRVAVDVPGGRRVSALRWGTGPAELVLLHGGAQNAHTWDTVALALDRPLVAVDLPGHGHSDWRDDHDYSPAALAADVTVVLDALAPAAGVVVGMSLGGLTSVALAAERPDLVRRLVLVDITPGVNADKARAITDFVSGPERFATRDAMVERTIAHHPGRSESSLRRGVLHNARQLPDGQWSWRWDPVRRSGLDAAVLSELWDALGALRVPLTLVRGAVSPVVDDEDVAELRRRRPTVRVEVVEGAGHSVQGDRPVELAGLLAAAAGEPA